MVVDYYCGSSFFIFLKFTACILKVCLNTVQITDKSSCSKSSTLKKSLRKNNILVEGSRLTLLQWYFRRLLYHYHSKPFCLGINSWLSFFLYCWKTLYYLEYTAWRWNHCSPYVPFHFLSLWAAVNKDLNLLHTLNVSKASHSLSFYLS